MFTKAENCRRLGATTLAGSSARLRRVAFFQTAPEEETAWVCPMHRRLHDGRAGKCPRCGMDLVHAAPFDVRDYRLRFPHDARRSQAGSESRR